jgi:hypothetical protein
MSDTLKYVKILEGAGVTREQAEAHVQLITEITEGDLATKQDLKIFEINLESKIQQLEYRIIIKLGTLLIIGFTTMATLMKFFLLR